MNPPAPAVTALKKIAFLVPRADLSSQDFREHWRSVHGPIVAGAPDYHRYRVRYVQNHRLGDGPAGRPFAYAGMAEFWLPAGVANEEAFSASPAYRDHIRPDERNFIDMDATISLTAEEYLPLAGQGPVKLVILDRRAARLSANAFRAAVLERLSSAGRSRGEHGGSLRGWSINLTLPGSFRLPGARPAEALGIDCIQALWFDSEEAARRSFLAADHAQGLGPIEAELFDLQDRCSVFVEELVFFDRGRAVQ